MKNLLLLAEVLVISCLIAVISMAGTNMATPIIEPIGATVMIFSSNALLYVYFLLRARA